MKLGVACMTTDESVRIDEVAIAAEQRGFESLFVPEHTHLPVKFVDRYPVPGNKVPAYYSRIVDPFIALAIASAVTKRIMLGTAICLVIEHDPIALAKQIASLDHLSNGRVVIGIGAGWNAEEMANHGTAFKSRWKLMRERVEAMKAIWTQDEAEYHGEFVNFDPIHSWPKPVQKPHPPVLMGSWTPKTVDRVIRYCDGCIPPANFITSDESRALLADLRKRWQEAGRDLASLQINMYWGPENKGQLRQLEDAGVTRVIFRLPANAKPDEVMRAMDACAKLLD